MLILLQETTSADYIDSLEIEDCEPEDLVIVKDDVMYVFEYLNTTLDAYIFSEHVVNKNKNKKKMVLFANYV
jgi:hypothetical protein